MVDSDRLDGWKEIADWLDRSVKTAQRWETDRGLPVRRVGDSGGASVYAFRSELEEWMRRDAATQPSGSVAPHHPEPDPSTGGRPRLLQRLPSSRGLIAVAIAGAVSLGLGAWVWLRPRPQPALAAVRDAHVMVVFDAGGQEIWTHISARPFFPNIGNPVRPPAIVVDLDRDGDNEVLFGAIYDVDTGPDSSFQSGAGAVLAFDAGGELMWRYDVPAGHESSGSSPPAFEDRRHYRLWTVIPVQRADRTWVAVIGHHYPSYPSRVFWLDGPSGTEVGSYLHAGTILSAAPFDLDDDGQEELLIGGRNEPLGKPVVAVLPPAAGAAGSLGTALRAGAGEGRQPETSYVALPGSLLAAELGMTSVVRFADFVDGVFTVEVTIERDEPMVREESVYTFDPGWTLRRLLIPRSFRAWHRRLQEEGRIRHQLSDEEEHARGIEMLVAPG